MELKVNHLVNTAEKRKEAGRLVCRRGLFAAADETHLDII